MHFPILGVVLAAALASGHADDIDEEYEQGDYIPTFTQRIKDPNKMIHVKEAKSDYPAMRALFKFLPSDRVCGRGEDLSNVATYQFCEDLRHTATTDMDHDIHDYDLTSEILDECEQWKADYGYDDTYSPATDMPKPDEVPRGAAVHGKSWNLSAKKRYSESLWKEQDSEDSRQSTRPRRKHPRLAKRGIELQESNKALTSIGRSEPLPLVSLVKPPFHAVSGDLEPEENEKASAVQSEGDENGKDKAPSTDPALHRRDLHVHDPFRRQKGRVRRVHRVPADHIPCNCTPTDKRDSRLAKNIRDCRREFNEPSRDGGFVAPAMDYLYDDPGPDAHRRCQHYLKDAINLKLCYCDIPHKTILDMFGSHL